MIFLECIGSRAPHSATLGGNIYAAIYIFTKTDCPAKTEANKTNAGS